ncbi:DoxX family protein [Streptosporangium sp. NPDC049046]|uniref:DoxX family protein n=1 Tax=Streptosporangium sp. NPDC049046 TaxID=3155031 RepID=UPI003435902B
MRTTTPRNRSKKLDLGLWAAQGLLALAFAGGGVWKLVTPRAQLAEIFPWVGETPPALLYATSAFDILGGIGVLLPALTRVKPGLTPLAALGCVALQVSAIVFHLSRGETDVAFNVVLLALALFVAWGRHRLAPIAPRG